MTCTRCQGLMVERPCWERDWRHVASRMTRGIYLWVCLNCGDCLDEVIAFNRQRPVDEAAERKKRVWRRIRDLCKEVAA